MNDSLNDKGNFLTSFNNCFYNYSTILGFDTIEKEHLLSSKNDHFRQPSFRSDIALNFHTQTDSVSPRFNESMPK